MILALLIAGWVLVAVAATVIVFLAWFIVWDFLEDRHQAERNAVRANWNHDRELI